MRCHCGRRNPGAGEDGKGSATGKDGTGTENSHRVGFYEPVPRSPTEATENGNGVGLTKSHGAVIVLARLSVPYAVERDFLCEQVKILQDILVGFVGYIYIYMWRWCISDGYFVSKEVSRSRLSPEYGSSPCFG